MRVLIVKSTVTGLQFDDGTPAPDQPTETIVPLDVIQWLQLSPTLDANNHLKGQTLSARLANGATIPLGANLSPKTPGNLVTLQNLMKTTFDQIQDQTVTEVIVTYVVA